MAHTVTIKEFPKTRVCRDCNTRKPLDEKHFHKQKPPRIYIIGQRMPDYRWDCNQCHSAKCRRRLLKVTTKAQRAQYIRDYFRVRIYGTLPENFRVRA
jgi:hypothetical protein